MTEDFSRRFAAARRQIIEKEYANLNPEQREAVLTTEGPLLLLAGAGSGKTTVLIHRVANILQFGRGADTRELPPDADETMLAALEDAAAGRTDVTDNIRRLCAVDPAAPWQVLAITFTNKAADELKNRLEAKLGEIGRDVWALTFHGTCVRILRRCADRIGFPNSFTIYDQADSLSVMKRILRDMNMDDKVFPPKAMLAAAGRYKGLLVSPEEAVAAEERSGDIRRIRTAKIYAAYAKHLQNAGAMDFDDLIYYTVRLLQDEPDVLAYYQKKFRYVLIDEYQDTNHLQYLFAALMASGSRNICVVGDDDQSIYKFRGATIENILSFEKQYPDARVIRLEQNYRSTGNILAAANAVIANNRERKGKTLWTAQSGGDPVTLFEARNEDDEADFVARTIASARRPMRDFAVLYRTNAQSRSIELALKRRSIPYRIFGGTRFFDRAEVKDILAYLSVIANPTDETRLLRIVNEPPRGIGATSLEKIREIAAAENISVFEAMTTASHRTGIAAGKRMEEFCHMIAELQEAVSALPLDEFYDAVVERTGYALALETKGGDENTTRLENIAELKSSIVKSVEANPDLDLYSYLDEVALYTDLDNYDRAEDAAVMMTNFRSCSLSARRRACSRACRPSARARIWRRSAVSAMWRSPARGKSSISPAPRSVCSMAAHRPTFRPASPRRYPRRCSTGRGWRKRKRISGMTTAHSSPEEAEHGAEAPPAIPAEGCPTGPAALARAMLHAPDGPARQSARLRKSRRPSCPRRKHRTSKRVTAWYIRRSVRA